MLIEKYNAGWITSFKQVSAELKNTLAGIDYTIEHVGSTAVPFLAAKPIIDIDIVYPTQSGFEMIKQRLEALGYYHNGNQGIADREVFKRTGNRSHAILDSIKHHLYVCPVGSAALERHILSRNFFIAHDWARLQYQQMKYALAEEASQDSKLYALLKEQQVNDFIDAILAVEKQARPGNRQGQEPER